MSGAGFDKLIERRDAATAQLVAFRRRFLVRFDQAFLAGHFTNRRLFALALKAGAAAVAICIAKEFGQLLSQGPRFDLGSAPPTEGEPS